MKRIKTLVLVAVLFIYGMVAIGCGSDSSSEKKEIVTNGSDSLDAADDASDMEVAGGSSSVDVAIEEQVLFEQDGLKVTAIEYVVDSIWGDGIKLLIENNGTSDIGLGCNALIVNDYMITDLFSASVAAGKKDYETLSLSSAGLKAAGVENVGQVEVYFHTFDSNTYMTISNIDCVTIKTSAYELMDTTPNDIGQELYNEDGIKIVGKYVDEGSFWGTAVLVYIENNSGKNCVVQCDDMSVNGFMVTPFFSSTVYDGKKAIDEITILSSDLEENNISSIEDIELKFKIYDEDFMSSKESDVIAFSAK